MHHATWNTRGLLTSKNIPNVFLCVLNDKNHSVSMTASTLWGSSQGMKQWLRSSTCRRSEGFTTKIRSTTESFASFGIHLGALYCPRRMCGVSSKGNSPHSMAYKMTPQDQRSASLPSYPSLSTGGVSQQGAMSRATHTCDDFRRYVVWGPTAGVHGI
eukprot:756977-Hanusia_phi.AAC.6